MGSTLRGILNEAKVEKRLVCGLLPAIAYLEKSPDDVVFCILPESRPGDAATHIHAVLLEAFCYENYIPVIKVRVITIFTQSVWSTLFIKYFNISFWYFNKTQIC